MGATESKLDAGWRRLQAYRERHAGAEIAVFFAAGCLFDILTLGRIDDVPTLVQLAIYLVVLAGLMLLDEPYRAGAAAPPAWLAKAWRFSGDAIHFLLGSMLSAFTIFYMKSSSGLASGLFLTVLCGLLVANELPRFRERGPVVRFALFGLCVTSYLILLLPILLGFLTVWSFVAAVVLATAIILGLARSLLRWTRDLEAILRRVAGPALAMQALLVGAYVAGLIPPVPLSVQWIGIYHDVVAPGAQAAAGIEDPERPATYALVHLRPWWKVWQHGDQDFSARPGDVVHCFARVFAPRGFRDAVYVRWLVRGDRGGWRDQGRARLDIRGGRSAGFRAIATKENYEPGRWRVEIETEDGRDIGVIHFDLVRDDSTGTRRFSIDRV